MFKLEGFSNSLNHYRTAAICYGVVCKTMKSIYNSIQINGHRSPYANRQSSAAMSRTHLHTLSIITKQLKVARSDALSRKVELTEEPLSDWLHCGLPEPTFQNCRMPQNLYMRYDDILKALLIEK